jgi:hypothetical protein
MADIIAMRVFTMLQEFNAVAEYRAFVQPRDEALDNLAGANLKPAYAANGRWVQKSAGIFLG